MNAPLSLEGWAKKRGEKGLIKGQKKRYFKQNGYNLEYSRDKGTNSIQGFIDLRNVTKAEKVNETEFRIITPNRLYLLETVPDGPSIDYWVNGVKLWVAYLIGTQKTSINSSSDKISIPLTSLSLDESETSEVETVKLSVTPSSMFSTPSLKLTSDVPPDRLSSLSKEELIDALKSKGVQIAQLRNQLEDLSNKIARLSANQAAAQRENPASYTEDVAYWMTLQSDDPNQFKNFLSTKPGYDTRKRFFMTPVHYTIMSGSLQALTSLVASSGIQVNEPDSAGQTAIMYAIEKLDNDLSIEAVQILLNHGADVEKGDIVNQMPPLHTACLSGYGDVVSLLLKAGADIRKVDGRLGWTPLHWAVMSGSSDICKLLLEKGLKNIKVKGVSPLDLAIENSKKDLIKLLKGR